jgi:hypothetical protein
MLKALIKTKTNFRNLNGTWLEVTEIKGNRVTCLHFDSELDRYITIDFTSKEVKEFEYSIKN